MEAVSSSRETVGAVGWCAKVVVFSVAASGAFIVVDALFTAARSRKHDLADLELHCLSWGPPATVPPLGST